MGTVNGCALLCLFVTPYREEHSPCFALSLADASFVCKPGGGVGPASWEWLWPRV